jgi:hypothetical protein
MGDHDMAGLMVNEFSDDGGGEFPAYWFACGGQVIVYGDDVCRPCGHGFERTSAGSAAVTIDRAWAEARNRTQWHAA